MAGKSILKELITKIQIEPSKGTRDKQIVEIHAVDQRQLCLTKTTTDYYK